MGLREFIKNSKKIISSLNSTASKSSKYDVPNNIMQNPSGYFKFEDFDKNGKRILKIITMSVSNMSGDNGLTAQEILHDIGIGEQILLEINEKNKDLCSVKVKNVSGIQIGWLKNGQTLEDHKYRYDVFARLERGDTVLARVHSKEISKNGKMSIKIDVARYAAR